MNSLTEYLTFNTKTRIAFVNITSQIEKLIKKSGIKDGLCLVRPEKPKKVGTHIG